MKWISNPEYKPTLGDTRYVMKFAFLPVYAWSYNDKLRYMKKGQISSLCELLYFFDKTIK